MLDLKSKLITKVKKLKGKRVLLRLDLNVPISGLGDIEDTFRLEAVLPTIEYLVSQEAKVIIVSHLGTDGKQSLAPVVTYLGKYFKTAFFPDLDNLFHIEELKNGEVAILENIRRSEGEMTNSPKVAKELAALADIYVNDAFSVSHRAHASIVGVAKYLPSYVGPLFFKEYENLSKMFKPDRPFLFILGGLKFQTKFPLLKKFISKADTVFVGGALANSVFKKLGYSVGQSVFDPNSAGVTEFLKSSVLKFPTDVVTEDRGDFFVRPAEGVRTKEMIVDIGPESLDFLKQLVKSAQFILWNGPLGNFEKGFNKGTLELARSIANSKAFSVVGGGDTVNAISDLKLEKEFGFVSTAGGAMLDFLANGTLPGLQAVVGIKTRNNKIKSKKSTKKTA